MIGSKVTPLQLLQSRKSPFLNILTTSPFFHTYGHVSVSQSLLQHLISLPAVYYMSALGRSGPTSSFPATFRGFVLLSASLTSCTRYLPTSISSIYSSSPVSSFSPTGFVGSSLFKISLKCSTHLCNLSCDSVLSIPFNASGFCNMRFFLQGRVVNPAPKLQLEDQWVTLSLVFYPSICSAWVTLPGV